MLEGIVKAVGAAKVKNPVVDFKLKILAKALPAESAVIFGDMWKVDGFYTNKTSELGCKRTVLIDSQETERWLRTRIQNPEIDFLKGDFSNTLFMTSVREKFDIGVVFDILLHQAPLLNTLHLMLEKIEKRICIVQPMLAEQKFPNTLVYLPGNSDELYPLGVKHGEFKMFNVDQVNQSHWIWGMTATFLRSVMRGEGFDLNYEEQLFPMPNEHWFWAGYVFERKCNNPSHWSRCKPTPGLFKADW